MSEAQESGSEMQAHAAEGEAEADVDEQLLGGEVAESAAPPEGVEEDAAEHEDAAELFLAPAPASEPVSAPEDPPSASLPASDPPAVADDEASSADEPRASTAEQKLERLLAPSPAPSSSSSGSEVKAVPPPSRTPAAADDDAAQYSPRLHLLPPVPQLSPKEKTAAAAKERARREAEEAEASMQQDRLEPIPHFRTAPSPPPVLAADGGPSPYGEGGSYPSSGALRTRQTPHGGGGGGGGGGAAGRSKHRSNPPPIDASLSAAVDSGVAANVAPSPMLSLGGASSSYMDQLRGGAEVAMRRQRAIEVKRRLNALQRELHATRGRTAARMVEAEKREAADALRAKSGNHALKRLLRGVEPADEATMTELSTTFNRRMHDTFADPSWIKLFRSIDTDHSGLISFQEIMALTRDELSLLPEDISDEQLKAFWLALDMDQSGFVGCGEFGAFMRKGEQVLQSEAEKTTWKAKLKAERKRRADRQRAARDAELNRDLSRANADGALQPAEDEEVSLLSRLCNERVATLYGEGAIHSLAAARGSSVGDKASLADPTKALTAAGPVHGALSQATWFSLFKRTDENDSGLICFHEWNKLIRTELGVKERHFPKQRLQACWLALDVDSSGFINAGEWAAFMRRGEPDQLRDKRLEYAMSKKYKARELYAEGEVMRQQKMYNEVVTATRNKRAAAAQRERDAERLKAAHRSHAEEVAQKRKLVRDQSDMTTLRRVLQSAPRATDEQVVRLAEACNEKLVAMADESEKAKWAPWFRLFKSVDTDGSGQISFDEFVALVRNDLGLAHDGFSSEAVKAVWVAMDIDASGYISCGEFAKFMRRGAHVIAGRKGPSREELLAERARLAKARRTADQLELYHGRHFDELASAAAASEADVKRLSVHFNARLRELREYELGIGGSHHASEAELRSLGADTGQWYHLFKRVDANANGYISFSEFSSLVRDELMLPESNVPDSVLRAVWRALDPSSSGLLQCGDFIAFMKQGMPEVSRNANAGAVARERVRQNGEWRRASHEQQRSQRKRAQLQEMDAEQRAYERRASALQRELEMELAMVRQTVGGVTQAMPVLPAGLPVDMLDDGSAAVHGRRVGQAEPVSGQQASRAMRKQEAAGRREGAKAGGRLKGAQSMSLLPAGGRASRPMVSSLSDKTLVRLPKI